MEILSENFKANFEGAPEREITLDFVESVFKEREIEPLRWAITDVDEARGVLTFDFSYCKRV